MAGRGRRGRQRGARRPCKRGAAGPGEAQQAYVCGPPPMVDATAAVLRQKGLPPDAIHADAYG